MRAGNVRNRMGFVRGAAIGDDRLLDEAIDHGRHQRRQRVH